MRIEGLSLLSPLITALDAAQRKPPIQGAICPESPITSDNPNSRKELKCPIAPVFDLGTPDLSTPAIGPALPLGRPLVSPGFAGFRCRLIRASAQASLAARWRTALLKKGPAIGDGSQSREEVSAK
jgi:hypothetical protein